MPEPTISVVTVDDTDAIRKLVALVLQLEGDIAVVGHACDGKEAIDVVSSSQPDVVLLDIAMPVMDGIEALPHLRAASPESQIVMLTGFGTEDIRRRCMQLGAFAFLDKGVIAKDIVSAVRNAAAAT